ncbi:MAG TPA: hypothetical protein VKB79_03030 [Bryobacteraceae bacterium]|nr:hypothetical protein [Bryobacteraceae bacterium]
MRNARRVALSWSSGKDSAWALHVLRQRLDIEVFCLLTSLNAEANRVAMHAVRRALVDEQARSTGLPLLVVELPWPCSNERYETLMSQQCAQLLADGIEAIAFGDLFLRDVRAYRESRLAGTGLEPLFPIWEMPTDRLAREMISAGLQARVTCVDPKQLDRKFAGREFGSEFLAELPASADPCGENGEFHTFAWDGPMFTYPIAIESGEVVERDGFVFADLLPAASARVIA